jgi:hypothetical protein
MIDLSALMARPETKKPAFSLGETRAFELDTSQNMFFGGSGEIRTHEGLTPSPVFKTGAFNRSATLPVVQHYT